METHIFYLHAWAPMWHQVSMNHFTERLSNLSKQNHTNQIRGALVSMFHPLHVVSVESLVVRGTQVLVTWTKAQRIQRKISMLRVSSLQLYVVLLVCYFI